MKAEYGPLPLVADRTYKEGAPTRRIYNSGKGSTLPTIYLIGSLRNLEVPKLGNVLREQGYDVFDDWWSTGKIADDVWRDYEKARGHDYSAALKGYAARHIFAQDTFHLNRAHAGVLVLPAGKSGHLEAGMLAGQGKPVFLMLENGKAPARLDVMTQFLHATCSTFNSLIAGLKEYPWPKLPSIGNISVTDACWLAGLIEGDGTICATGPVPRIVVQMTDKDVVTRAAKLFQRGVWGGKQKTKGNKKVWACGAAGLTAIEWMRILRPMFGQRRQQQILDTVEAWLTHRKYNTRDDLFWRRMFRLR